MLNLRNMLGKTGENLAVKYLKKKGYTILETNYRNPLGEIDIIAKEKGTIVFVEVKTRKNNRFANPKEAVTLKKQKTIARVAQIWLKQKKKIEANARFDVVAILTDQNKHDIELIKHAFSLDTSL